MKNLFIFLVLALFIFDSAAQQWKNYTCSLYVACTAPDHDTLWVGSQGGLAKYLIDGTKLANYTHADGLVSNSITSIAIDRNGNKWIGTNAGISKFNGTSWVTYSTANSGLQSNSIRQFAIDIQNNIWIACVVGLTKFDGINWTNYNSSNSPIVGVTSIVIDKLGNKWLGYSDYNSNVSPLKFDGTNWVSYASITKGIVCMAVDSANNIWIGSGSYVGIPGYPGLILRFNGTTWDTIRNYSGIAGIAIDDQGNKWFADNAGVQKYDDVNWTSYNNTCGSVYNQYNSNIGTTSISIDRWGNKWIGKSGGGLCKFDGTNWENNNPSNSGLWQPKANILAIDHHNDKWMYSYGYGGRLTRFDGINWDSFAPNGNSIYFRTGAVDKNDMKWFGGEYYGPYSLADTTWTTYPTIYNVDVNTIAVDRHNNVWFCTQGQGVYKFNTTWNHSNSGLLDDYVGAVAIDEQDNKWFGSYTGVSKFDGTNWVNYTRTNSGLGGEYVNAIAIDLQGNKWIGTDKGISKFDGVNWINYDTTNSGLPGDWVKAIAIDKSGNVWISISPYENKGVTKFDGTNWTTYTTSNSGLGNNAIWSIMIDEYDNKWFGTEGGISELTGTDTIGSTWSDSTFSVWLNQFNQHICNNNLITLNPVVNYGTPPYTFLWQATGNSLSCNNCQYPTANLTQNSVYIVFVTDANNHTTSDTLHVYACTSTGVKEVNEASSFSIYPNPANESVTISVSENMIGNKLTVYDVTGRKMAAVQLQTTNFKLETTRFASGVYFVTVENERGRVTRKLVINN